MGKLYFVVIHKTIREMWIESVSVEKFNLPGICYKDIFRDPVNQMVVFESYNKQDCINFIEKYKIQYRHDTKYNELNFNN